MPKASLTSALPPDPPASPKESASRIARWSDWSGIPTMPISRTKCSCKQHRFPSTLPRLRLGASAERRATRSASTRPALDCRTERDHGKHRVTTAWFTVGWFNQIVEADPTAMHRPRPILTGGDALSMPHIQKARLALRDATRINGYGPTENTTFSTCYQIPSTIAWRTSIPIGRPIRTAPVTFWMSIFNPVRSALSG